MFVFILKKRTARSKPFHYLTNNRSYECLKRKRRITGARAINTIDMLLIALTHPKFVQNNYTAAN